MSTSSCINFASQAGTPSYQITGVQLEKGSCATSFEFRPYNIELSMCQRYYERLITLPLVCNYCSPLGAAVGTIFFETTKRSSNYSIDIPSQWQRFWQGTTLFTLSGSGNFKMLNATSIAVVASGAEVIYNDPVSINAEFS